MQYPDDLDRTVRIRRDAGQKMPGNDIAVTIFDGERAPYTIELNRFGKAQISFGRAEGNDIVMSSRLVSHQHGRFVSRNGQWVIEDKGAYAQSASTNGLIYNDRNVMSRILGDGDFIRIDDGVETISEGVLFVISTGSDVNKWESIMLNGQGLTIGRDSICDIVLDHVSVSKCHALMSFEQGRYYLTDNNSTNGIVINDHILRGKTVLHEKDVISIANAKLIFTSSMLSYCTYRSGVTVDASNVVIKRGKGRKQFVTSNHVSLNIRPGELVAIIGGSGAGKSTILNCMCGYLPPTEGHVYINNVDLYKNFDSLKEMVGYVPQSDIVYDNLTLEDMLKYTARLRLPKDVTPAEAQAQIDRAIEMVDLTEKKKSFIKSLSGGQRKRASIAVELLSDPKLLFLDEPSSGLDPGTERNLMKSLKKMAEGGKTVILVTHSTLQLELCDRIVFMGKGGNLCYFGSAKDAREFFGVDDLVDVYNMITENAPLWRDKYNSAITHNEKNRSAEQAVQVLKTRKNKQLPVLCSRYLKLVINDRQRLLLLLVQAPILALLISLVADGNQFEIYGITKSLLFALSCSAFWVGMLNAIQEICKERSIIKREYMTGLSLTSYVFSKVVILGALCLFQSICIIGVFWLRVGMPEEGLFLPPYLEMLITAFLTSLASAAMGLFVSSLFTNADRAMTVAPILLMPQILFSGLAFELKGATEIISWFATCRWSMEGFGTTANLNELPQKVPQSIMDLGIKEISRDPESFFDFTVSHMLIVWGVLLAFIVVFLLLARLCIGRIGRETA